jgi:hypothetical protein
VEHFAAVPRTDASIAKPVVESGVMRTEESTRKRLWGLMGRLPYGSKAQLAHTCGFAGRRRLRAVARFNAYLTKPVARRLERIMDAIESGELVLCATGRPYRSRYGQFVWVWRQKP